MGLKENPWKRFLIVCELGVGELSNSAVKLSTRDSILMSDGEGVDDGFKQIWIGDNENRIFVGNDNNNNKETITIMVTVMRVIMLLIGTYLIYYCH